MRCANPVIEEKSKRKKPKKNAYSFNLTGYLKQILGVDLTTIPGIDASTALKLISEIGTDITRWQSSKHFCSWLGLCPGTKISGGKRLSGRTKPCRNKAAICLRMAASTLHRSQTAFGAYLRKAKSRHGPVQATTALGHKMARAIYCMMSNKETFNEMGANYYDDLHKDRTLKYLRKRASSLGFSLVESLKTA
jgi:transposase